VIYERNRKMAGMTAILVTGGAGFIGANFVLEWLRRESTPVVNLDALTYAGNLASLDSIAGDPRHHFVHGDINDRALVARLLREHDVSAIINFAAESHVDRSIVGPDAFVQTNIVGTFNLIEAARAWVSTLDEARRTAFRFLQVSTDEVFGALEPDDPAFSETTPFSPRSPYSASKAAADHLVQAAWHTYGLPALITHCSNNYGPLQFPEKLIPLMIRNARRGDRLPVYGDGRQVRDWLHVSDHASALRAVLARGKPGETYNIGGQAERENLVLVNTLCRLLDELSPRTDGKPYAEQIAFVTDRPGHDRRYAIDQRRIAAELDWVPAIDFDAGLRDTVRWYLDNDAWINAIETGEYRQWLDRNYTQQGRTS
jgi:dTDP-glucose 4,6-dehydratase